MTRAVARGSPARRGVQRVPAEYRLARYPCLPLSRQQILRPSAVWSDRGPSLEYDASGRTINPAPRSKDKPRRKETPRISRQGRLFFLDVTCYRTITRSG